MKDNTSTVSLWQLATKFSHLALPPLAHWTVNSIRVIAFTLIHSFTPSLHSFILHSAVRSCDSIQIQIQIQQFSQYALTEGDYKTVQMG